MQSRNIVFTGKDQVEIATEPVHDPRAGEVLIRARKTLISTGTESICLSRLFAPGSHWDQWVKYPFHPGYSMVGEVVAIGPGVEGIQEGDRFALREPHKEYVTVSTRPPERQVLLTQPPSDLYPVPDEISDDEAPWAGLATIVQNGVRYSRQELGETVAIIGLGLLGQLLVQYVRLSGAKQVIAIDVSERRLEMAKKHGATLILPMGVDEAREAVLRATEGAGVGIVYDVTGAAPVFSSALALLRRFGRLVLLGDTGDPTQQHLTSDLITKGLSVISSHDSNPPAISTEHAYWSKGRMAELFFTYLARGDMHVADLITHRFSPLEAEQAYRLLREQRASAMGVMFDWTRF